MSKVRIRGDRPPWPASLGIVSPLGVEPDIRGARRCQGVDPCSVISVSEVDAVPKFPAPVDHRGYSKGSDVAVIFCGIRIVRQKGLDRFIAAVEAVAPIASVGTTVTPSKYRCFFMRIGPDCPAAPLYGP